MENNKTSDKQSMNEAFVGLVVKELHLSVGPLISNLTSRIIALQKIQAVIVTVLIHADQTMMPRMAVALEHEIAATRKADSCDLEDETLRIMEEYLSGLEKIISGDQEDDVTQLLNNPPAIKPDWFGGIVNGGKSHVD